MKGQHCPNSHRTGPDNSHVTVTVTNSHPKKGRTQAKSSFGETTLNPRKSHGQVFLPCLAPCSAPVTHPIHLSSPVCAPCCSNLTHSLLTPNFYFVPMCASTLLFVACDRHSTGRLLSRPGYTRVTPARRLLHRPATQPDHGMPSASTRIPANGLPALTTLSRPLQTGTAHLMIRPLLPARATRAPVLTALCHVPARAGPGTAPRHGPGLLGTSRPLRPGRRRRCALTRLGPDTRVTYPGRPAPTPRPALLQI